MTSWYDSDEAKVLRERHPKACKNFMTSLDQSWGPRTCILCGHSEVSHRAMQMKPVGAYVEDLAPKRRRFNKGDTVKHSNPTIAHAWGQGTIEEVKLLAREGNAYRVVFPNAKFDPQIAGWPRVPAGDGVWLNSRQMELVKRAPVVIHALKDDDDVSDLWDQGKHILYKPIGELYEIPAGQQIGDVLFGWTKCPVNNATCTYMAIVDLCATHPDRGNEKVLINLCPLGIDCIDNCPLSK